MFTSNLVAEWHCTELCFLSFLPFWSYSGCGKRSTFLGPACLIFSGTGLALVHPKSKFKYFFSYFVWFSLKRCIGIHDYADSVRGTIKTANCRTLLKTKQHDITHNRSTDVFLWSHDIISKHRQLLVSNSTLTNQPHNHKFHWLQELHFRLAAFRDKRKASFPSFHSAVTELRAAPGPSHGDCTKSGNVRKILVKDAFPIQSSPRKNS